MDSILSVVISNLDIQTISQLRRQLILCSKRALPASSQYYQAEYLLLLQDLPLVPS